MSASADGVAPERPGPAGRVSLFLTDIKFSHTLFALPFALLSLVWAARAHWADSADAAGDAPAESWRAAVGDAGAVDSWSFVSRVLWPTDLLLVLGCMVGARTAAMSFNRIADRRLDRDNPRNAHRALPSGRMGLVEMWTWCAGSIALFVTCAALLNPLCFALSPVALAVVLGYSLSKRFTSLSHLVLGLALGIAPTGAWLAVTGAFHPAPLALTAGVMFWVAAFDVLYSLQDIEADRAAGLRSIPALLGERGARWVAAVFHVGMLAGFVGFWWLLGRPPVLLVGIGASAVLAVAQHLLARPDDARRMNAAFFSSNILISGIMLVTGVL